MNLEIIIAGIIAVSVLILAKKVRNDKKLKKVNKDLNIEFGSPEGTGIELIKKQYPEMEFKDDFRQSSDFILLDGEKIPKEKYFKEPSQSELRDIIDRPERHNIAGPLNRPTEEQKETIKREKDGTNSKKAHDKGTV